MLWVQVFSSGSQVSADRIGGDKVTKARANTTGRGSPEKGGTWLQACTRGECFVTAEEEEAALWLRAEDQLQHPAARGHKGTVHTESQRKHSPADLSTGHLAPEP